MIALSLVFGGITLAQASDTIVEVNKKQEKIGSPAEIKNFTNIIKRGKELFGMRKLILEKIKHPSEIENFEKIRKIGSALWGMRKIKNPVLIKPEVATCVKTAIDKKDMALKTEAANGLTNLNNTIDTRNACQKLALDKTTAKEQWEANKICVDSYKKAIQTGKEALKSTQKTIWETYKTDLKACSPTEEVKVEDGGLGIEL